MGRSVHDELLFTLIIELVVEVNNVPERNFEFYS